MKTRALILVIRYAIICIRVGIFPSLKTLKINYLFYLGLMKADVFDKLEVFYQYTDVHEKLRNLNLLNPKYEQVKKSNRKPHKPF